ncbi:MAG: toprim domain-containing protein [Anaerolineales bacterium]|nr:toprim domain-containing protein [Anaerolineales bacterium]
MTAPTIDTTAIKQRHPISALVGGLHQRGRWHIGPCPKCGGEDRFNVKDDEVFLCRQCHPDYGDVIEFVRWLNNMNFAEAVAWLENAPQVVQVAPTKKERTRREFRPLRDGNWHLHPKAVNLWQSYKPLTAETIAAHRLGVGYMPRSKCRHERLLVPIYSKLGLVMVRGRRLHDDDPHKHWLASGGWEGVTLPLYNWQSVRAGEPLFICENPIDALLSTQSGQACVATYASGYWYDEWTQFIVAQQPSVVVLAGDNDEAGRTMNQRIRQRLTLERVRCHDMQWPEGMGDLGQLLAKV